MTITIDDPTSANQYNGGAGVNTLDYGSANAFDIFTHANSTNVFVDLSNGLAVNGFGLLDTFTNYQNVIGGAGGDILIGAATDNVFTGAQGADIFVMTASGGHDTITDFSHADGDRIDVSAWTNIGNFADVQAHAAPQGSDTLITVGSDSVLLQNVTLANLTAADFVFQGSYAQVTILSNATVGPAYFHANRPYDLVQGALTTQGNLVIESSSSSDSLVAFGADGTSFNATLHVTGTVTVVGAGNPLGTFGFFSDGYNSTFINNNEFSVSGSGQVTAVDFQSVGQSAATNTVSLTATSIGGAAIGILAGTPITITNSGSLTVTGATATAISVQGGSISNSYTITATNTGGGSSQGIVIGGSSSAQESIQNSGTITADHAIVVGGSGPSVTLTNTGAIHGAILLGATGNDTYDGHSGTQTGGIYLGGGHDTVYLGADGETVVGGSGQGTIHAGTGADTLTGGSGADTYVFGATVGHTTITNFSDAKGDLVDLSVFASLHTLGDVLAVAQQVGSDTVISLGGGTITLQNVLKGNLVAGDFALAPLSYDVATTSTPVIIPAGLTINASQPTPVVVFYPISGGTLINRGSIYLSGSDPNYVTTVAAANSGGQDPSAVFQNDGLLSVTGPKAVAVASQISLINTGTVSVSGSTAFGSNGNLTNSGAISVAGSSLSAAVVDGLSGGLVQNLLGGGLSVSAGGPTGVGVYMLLGGEVDNAGAITVSGLSSAAGGLSYNGILIAGPGNLGHGVAYSVVNNAGTITASGAEAVGVLLAATPVGGVTDLVPLGQYNIVNSGTITAPLAIGSSPSAVSAAVNNSGVLNGGISLGAQGNRILNTGAINGSVLVGGGSSIDSHLGTITGVITLGPGASTALLGAEDNTVNLWDGSYSVDGGAGVNTVSFALSSRGVVANLALQGQAQNTGLGTDILTHFQKVIGSAFHDTLTAADGSVLTGGAGGDSFAVASNTVHATVKDFSHAQGDRVDLSGLHLFHTFADVIAAAVQAGADTVIHLGSGSIILQGVTKTALTSQDFILSTSTSDFAQTGSDALLFRNTSTGDWGFMQALPGGGEAWHSIGPSSADYAPLGRGDFNGDGVLDTAFRQTGTGNWGFMTIGPTGGQTWHGVGSASTAYDAVAIGDVLGAGSAAIVFRNAATGDWGFMTTNGSSEAWHPIGPTGAGYDVVGYGDFNADGVFDVAFRNSTTGDWGFMSVNPTGGETWHGVGSASTAYAPVASADFMSNGQTEIIFRSAATGDWGFMQANIAGGETWHPIGPTGTGYAVIGNGDYNGDGVQDVAFRNTSTGDWGYMTVNPSGGETWHGVGSASLAYGTI